MAKKEYISITELAQILGISRVAIHKKIKKGQIKAEKVGRTWVVSRKQLNEIIGAALSDKDKKIIDEAVEKTIREYGEVLKLLGKE